MGPAVTGFTYCPAHQREHDAWAAREPDREKLAAQQAITRGVCAFICRRHVLRMDFTSTCPGCEEPLLAGQDVTAGRLPSAPRTTGLVLWHTPCLDGEGLL